MNWTGQNVFVTGACGFIGSHLTEALVRSGARVKALALYNAQGSRGWLDEMDKELASSVEIISGDVRDAEMMRSLVTRDSVVFHLAALIGIPYSYQAPRSYVETNITGTLNILEAARQVGAQRTLVISTSEVYGSALRVPIDEDHPLQGQSPYSATKIGAEKLAESYVRSFELPITVVRPFNTFGPRQSPRAVIPTVLMQLMRGDDIRLGDLETTRDFNYVADTVEGMMRLAASPAAAGRVVNIGTGHDVSVGAVVELAGRILGRRANVVVDDDRIRPVASEVRRLCACNKRLREMTGWVPPARLEEGMRLTAAWLETQLGRYETSRYYV